MPEFCHYSSPKSVYPRMRLLKNCLSAAVLLLLLSLTGLQAQAEEALVNSETEVDVTGKDAADARDLAVSRAQQDALVALLNKFTTPEQTQAIINNLDTNKIASMVRGTEVRDEKISSNRYRARIIVTFDGNQISALIGRNGTAVGSDVPNIVGSFLIIPSYEEDNTQLLWEDNNPWRAAWKTIGLEITTGDMVVPYGDNTDASIVSPTSVSSVNFTTLIPLTVRYGVSDIVILQAKFTHAPDMVLTVIKRRINRTGNEVNLLTYRADPQETKELLLLRAARDIADQLERKKTEELENVKVIRGGERNTVMMLANISTLASWTQLRAKLTTLPMVDQLEVRAISPQQVDMVVHYRGTPDSLANAITSLNLRLVKNPKYWVVSRD